MKTELRNEGGYWSLFVDGICTIDRESFAVADRVRYHLEHAHAYDNSESAEVADSIRRWRECAELR